MSDLMTTQRLFIHDAHIGALFPRLESSALSRVRPLSLAVPIGWSRFLGLWLVQVHRAPYLEGLGLSFPGGPHTLILIVQIYCCHNPEILNANFWTGRLHLYFALDLTNQVADPVKSTHKAGVGKKHALSPTCVNSPWWKKYLLIKQVNY